MKEEGGIGELLGVAYPLVLSTASHTVMQFISRIFLSRYSADTLAACVPAGILSFTLICFFMGTASYTNAFVSQYHGKGKAASVTVAVWQGVWLGLISGLILLALTPAGLYLIDASGHPASVKLLEKQYFTILNGGGVLVVVNTALAAFFTGRGRTKVTMAANMAGNAVCVLLSWLLIFGNGPAPELGIRGAAWAAVIGQACVMAIYLAIIFSDENRRVYRTTRLVGVHRGLFKRLIKFGAPNGVGFFLDIASFGVFIFMVGNMDKYSLAANNIIASINMIAFMPVIGLGLANLTLVGRYIGKKRPDISVKVTWNAVKLAVLYVLAIGFLFFAFPGFFVNIFGSPDSAEFAPILAASRPLMKVLAFFILFDAIGIVFVDALRGAGDTRFQMITGSAMAWLLFVPGIYYLVNITHSGLMAVWMWALIYMILLAAVFGLRFNAGRWRSINILKD
ncbi:MAG: MATE family efflux transporter [Elusimicrobiota bacterium]